MVLAFLAVAFLKKGYDKRLCPFFGPLLDLSVQYDKGFTVSAPSCLSNSPGTLSTPGTVVMKRGQVVSLDQNEELKEKCVISKVTERFPEPSDTRVPFATVYNYGFMDKTTLAGYGNIRLSLSFPCRPRATSYLRLITTAPGNFRSFRLRSPSATLCLKTDSFAVPGHSLVAMKDLGVCLQ